jgi:putative copper resistance protein D
VRILYLANVYAHILAAMVWIGGSAFIALVIAPLMRRHPGAVAGLRAAALRFRTVGWISLAILTSTGAANLAFRGIGVGELLTGAAFRGAAGHALAGKLGAFAILLAISGLHDFKWGPAAVRALEADPGSPEALLGRRRAARVGRFVFLLGLFIVGAAVVFVRGGT